MFCPLILNVALVSTIWWFPSCCLLNTALYPELNLNVVTITTFHFCEISFCWILIVKRSRPPYIIVMCQNMDYYTIYTMKLQIRNWESRHFIFNRWDDSQEQSNIIKSTGPYRSCAALKTTIWPYLVWFGQFGFVWSSLVCFGWVDLSLVWSGFVWSFQFGLSQTRTEDLDWCW